MRYAARVKSYRFNMGYNFCRNKKFVRIEEKLNRFLLETRSGETL